MKRSLPLILPILSIILLLNACVTGKNAVNDIKADTEKSKEINTVCFVQKNDGTIVNFSALKLVNAVFNDAYLLADNKMKIYPKDIKAYQNKDHYAVSQTGFATVHKSYVAVEALPGFAVRIAKGKLNVYCKKFFNGAHAVDEYYIQAGDQGQIFKYTPALMNEMLKDNTEAVSYFNSKNNTLAFSKKLQATAAIFNNERLVSKN